jgi:hypothetical protein
MAENSVFIFLPFLGELFSLFFFLFGDFLFWSKYEKQNTSEEIEELRCSNWTTCVQLYTTNKQNENYENAAEI